MSEISKLFNRYIAAISAENVTYNKPALEVQNEHARADLDNARFDLRAAIVAMGGTETDAHWWVQEVGVAWLKYIEGDCLYPEMQEAHTQFIERLSGLAK